MLGLVVDVADSAPRTPHPAPATAPVAHAPPFDEPRPDLVTPNPGGSDDPLGESVLDPAAPWCRVFVPRDVRVVIGRHQDPARETVPDRCRADGVPIHRRVAGGGAVVLAPGMVVVALRLKPDVLDPAAWFARINGVIAPAVAPLAGEPPATHRLGDLTLTGEDGVRRKFLGASLRQTARMAVYLGVLLVDDAVPLMEAYLRQPSREPDYRAGRGHRAFCIHLGSRGVRTDDLRSALDAALRHELAAVAG